MKKYYITAFILIISITILLTYIIFTLNTIKNNEPTNITAKKKSRYEIFVGSDIIGEYSNFTDATREASLYENSYIIDANTGERVWNKNPRYMVIDELNKSYDFIFYKDAVEFAKTIENAKVYNIYTREAVWDVSLLPANSKLIAPSILQLPELARGCEVTSMTMLLQHAGINVDKMKLAQEIRKDDTPYKIIDGKIHFGNPHIGFVGDIYSFSNPGYGVYHEPMNDLLEKYLPNQVVDLTGTDFENILYFVSKGYPVVVITNSTYAKLQDSQFETWSTQYGDINITYHEHSVLVTGYDENYIYFNDPLNYTTYAKIDNFKEAWVQMGSQALSYTNYPN